MSGNSQAFEHFQKGAAYAVALGGNWRLWKRGLVIRKDW
jgi:hypothetical protein